MTLEAASSLIDKGFKVLPYINADPALAKRLEDIGCATVMPLASPIGSGNGIKNEESIKIIIDQSKIPVIVDAGIAVPSDASKMLEIGADAVLVNTAIAQASKPDIMAKAFKLGVEAGRNSFLAGRIDSKPIASPSSPEINLIDGGTSRGTTAVADGDGLLVNDDGTMRMTNVTTLKTYFQSGVGIAADDISAGDLEV